MAFAAKTLACGASWCIAFPRETFEWKAASREARDFRQHLLYACNNSDLFPENSECVTMAISTMEREHGTAFLPRFDDRGLLSAVVLDSRSREVLMVAFMDAEALAKTRESGLAHFHSRSRAQLWLKGESSGHYLHVEEIRVDCDQDALVIYARPDGPTCHTGARSCFYRRLSGEALESV